MAEIGELSVLVKAVDELSATITQIAGNFEQASSKIEEIAQRSTQNLERLRNAGLALSGIGAVVSGAFMMMSKVGSDYANTVREAALRTGMTVEEFSLLRSVLADLEVPAESLDLLISRLTMSMNRARTGAKMGDDLDNAASAFARLGIYVTDANGRLKDASTVFRDVLIRLAEVPNESEQAAIAMLLFGRSGYAILPAVRQGRQAIEETMEAHLKAGVAIRTQTAAALDDLQDSVSLLNTSLRALSANFAAAFAPALTSVNKQLISLISSVNAFLTQHPTLAQAIGTIGLAGGAIATTAGTALATLSQLAIVAANWGVLVGVFNKVAGAGKILAGIFGIIKIILGFVAGGITALAAALGLPVTAVIALITAITAAIAALIAFRNEVLNFIKNAVMAFWEWLKRVWEIVKKVPGVMWDALRGAITVAYEWGKNFILSIAKGIWENISTPVRAMQRLLQRLRDMLPFSDPKTGPLRDLTKATRQIGVTLSKAMDISVIAPRVPTQLAIGTTGIGRAYSYTVHITTDRQIDERVRAKIDEFVESLRGMI